VADSHYISLHVSEKRNNGKIWEVLQFPVHCKKLKKFGYNKLIYVGREQRVVWSPGPTQWIRACFAFGLLQFSAVDLTPSY
jgi:hypothetical protein